MGGSQPRFAEKAEQNNTKKQSGINKTVKFYTK
jgi:hypothetical protein